MLMEVLVHSFHLGTQQQWVMAPISHYNCELLKLILAELHDIPGFSPNFSNNDPCSTQLDQLQLQTGPTWGFGVISEQVQRGFWWVPTGPTAGIFDGWSPPSAALISNMYQKAGYFTWGDPCWTTNPSSLICTCQQPTTLALTFWVGLEE